MDFPALRLLQDSSASFSLLARLLKGTLTNQEKATEYHLGGPE
jgi:hypothetical protein